MSSKVYYTDFHTTVDEPLTKKLAPADSYGGHGSD